jgi:hypothetical protein
MRTLFTNLDLKIILLAPVLFAYLIFRLLRFGIGPKSLTNWFWGESAGRKPKWLASK